MIELAMEHESLILRAEDGDFKPRHESQLAIWGFKRESNAGALVANNSNVTALATKIVTYFDRNDLQFAVQPSVRALIQEQERACAALQSAL